jgi:hypothetical protein
VAVKQATREVVEPSRFIGVRLQPVAQVALNTILETGGASDTTEAVHKALVRAARVAKRQKRSAA